jgi:uncharacterized membrane protein YgdD (TMEM256/DUF423 family)
MHYSQNFSYKLLEYEILIGNQTIQMKKRFVILGACAGFLAVALGAFGAHALSGHFETYPDLESTYQTAVEYQFYHALAILVVAWAGERWPGRVVAWAGYLFGLGALIFSGSLYLLVLTNTGWWGAVTPIGGVAFLAGWVCLGWGVWRGEG